MNKHKKVIFTCIELLGGFKLLRWLNRNKPQILMYHRIIDDLNLSSISTSVFEQQLIYLKSKFRVVGIDTLIDEIKSNSIKPNTVAITFDDGHYDFYVHAWPLLKKYNLPATLYVTTGFVEGTHWLWPDKLKYILENAKIKSKNSSVQLDKVGVIPELPSRLSEAWNLIGDYCLTIGDYERLGVLEDLAIKLGVTVPVAAQSPYHAVSWQQLNEMRAEGLDVGSHTVSHPILALQSKEKIGQELHISQAEICKKLGDFSMGICYPNGRPEDINSNVILEAQKNNYRYGVLARNLPCDLRNLFTLGRLAANGNYIYFKWLMARKKYESKLVTFTY